ncbi:Avr9/Cf-9 rapidly elicited protein [Parasponia andersonii]|uniref:Avr9/Cf-9 rapidly elicited protein n=1 Tax=Parasponia andersonii TaxID=3476 RepID=A0A2P5D3L6_PARAD|nr:Avr9/Cf-9 rapidly elicited protein [Parasponia andersonii]
MSGEPGPNSSMSALLSTSYLNSSATELTFLTSSFSFSLSLSHAMESSSSSSSSPPLISRKLSNVVRLIMFTIQKGVSTKRKRLMMMMNMIPTDHNILHVMMERGKVLGKSFNDLMIRHNTALGCSSHDVRMSFVSPREYEFSCSSTPPHRSMHPSRLASNKKKPGRYVNGRGGGRYYNNGNSNCNKHVDVGYYKQYYCSNHDDVVSVISSVKSSLRGGGGASTTGGDDEFHVDKAAEEFIERFYRELMLQKWNMAREATAAKAEYRFG